MEIFSQENTIVIPELIEENTTLQTTTRKKVSHLISLRKHLDKHGAQEEDFSYSDEDLTLSQRLSDIIRFKIFRVTVDTLVSNKRAALMRVGYRYDQNGNELIGGSFRKVRMGLHGGNIYGLELTTDGIKQYYNM